jgi:transcriptional regulator with XRE-family HTH domain
MPESRISRADRRTRWLLDRLGTELRTARQSAGLTLDQVGKAVRLSPSELSRIERGFAPWLDIGVLCRIASVVGLDVSLRLYPAGEPLRDLAHLRLADAFRSLLGSGLVVRAEVPIGDHRDLRAWDLTLADRSSRSCGVELETRFVDVQEQLRRLTRKVADGGLGRFLLVVADTRSNRAAIRAAAAFLGTTFAIDDPAAYDALARGEVPPRNALLLVKLPGRSADPRQDPTEETGLRTAPAAPRRSQPRCAVARQDRVTRSS